MRAVLRAPRRMAAAQLAGLAALSYLPLLLTAPGKVAADTKAYLYLDPSRLLSRAPYLWDPNVAMGTVTHQNIGYLWPMGPWFWSFEQLGVPDWVAQRLWMGTLLFAAGAGVLHLGRTIGPRARLPWTVAAVVYLTSPYVLDYIARISVLLLPWAALPWMIGLTQRALRTGSWWHPAAFALLVATAGGINATALVFAGLGPVLWLLLSWRVHGEVTLRRAVTTVLRMGVLTLACNLWWIAGLAVQSGWGLDVLRYTETVETVARTSLASEVQRGLGYWFFYGTDKLGAWIEPGHTFTEEPWLIIVGFVLPVAALAGLAVTRWRYRGFAIVLVVIGTLIAVGAYPFDHPSPIGALFKRFATSSSAGLALRSTARAVPLVVLGQAMLLAAALAALARRRPRAAVTAGIVALLVAGAANPALWTGEFVGRNLRRPEHVPAYWREAAAWLDDRGGGTRVLELPGSDFAAYRWGNSVDPITPGLMDRPWVARELIPFGTEPSADLLIALDHRIQEGILDPEALEPVARLMGVGDIVIRGDLEYERYRTARPAQVWALVEPRPDGLDAPVTFGAPSENRATPLLPMHDEIYFANRDRAVRPPVAALPVDDPLPIVRVRDASDPIVVEGDGEGIVDAAAAGLLGGRGVVLSAPALAARPDVLSDALRRGGRIVVTDTNRKRARRWGTVRDNEGFTERPDQRPLRVDWLDNRMPVFPDAPPDEMTIVEQRGVVRVEATSYGNAISYTPGDRPANAFDGDPGTAWAVGAFGPIGGERLLIEAHEPVTTDRLDVVQAIKGKRRITRLGVRLDGEHVTTARLTRDSVGAEGQRIDLGGSRTFRTLELVIEGDNVGRQPEYADQNAVGLAEVRAAGLHVDQVVRVPDTLLRNAKDAAATNPLDIVLTRLRAAAAEPFASDEEPTIVRAFRLPAGRTFALAGTVRLDATQPDDRLDAVLGGVSERTARSSGRLPGDLAVRASAAIDGDVATAWTNHVGPQRGAWLEVEVDEPITVDRFDLQVVADGEHSVPTRVTVTADDGAPRTVELPAVRDGRRAGHLARVPVHVPGLTGRRFRITIDDVRAVKSRDWFSKRPIAMPVSIAELGVPAFTGVPAAGAPIGCRDDVLTIDGRPVSIEVTGRITTAEALGGLEVALCGDDAAGIELGAGDHELRTAPGWASGLDVDRLVLRSGTSSPASRPERAAGASVEILDEGRTSFDVRVRGKAGEAVWLVLGQSRSSGWEATADGESLGEPELVDGYANGWLVRPGADGTVDVALRWRPQRIVWAGLAASILGVLACLVILVVGWRGHRRLPDPAAPAPVWAPEVAVQATPASPARTAGLAVLAGVAVGVLAHPVLGVLTAAATVGALRWHRGRAVGLAGAATLAVASLYTAIRQVIEGYAADFGWPDHFNSAHLLAYAALALVVLRLLVDRERR